MFFPSDTAKTIFYHVDYEKLKREGYKLLLFDVDGTCVTDNVPVDVRSIEFFESLRKMGFKYGVVSNNYRDRVLNFASGIDADVTKYEARKPSPKKYLEACEDLNIKPEETVFFGDQLATDILGANKAGIKSVVVDSFPYDILIGVALKRYIEAPFILISKFYNHVIKGYNKCLCSKKISKEDRIKQKAYEGVMKKQVEYAKSIAYMVRSQYLNINSGIGTCCASLVVDNLKDLKDDINAISNLLSNEKYKSKLNFIELRIDKYLALGLKQDGHIENKIGEIAEFLIKNHNNFTNLEAVRFIITVQTDAYGGFFPRDKYLDTMKQLTSILSSNKHLNNIVGYVDMEINLSDAGNINDEKFALIKLIKKAGYFNTLSCYAGASVGVNLRPREFYDKVYNVVKRAGFNLDEMNAVKFNFYCNALKDEERFTSEILNLQNSVDVTNFSFLMYGADGLVTRKDPTIFKNILNFYSINNKSIQSQISFKEFVDGLK